MRQSANPRLESVSPRIRSSVLEDVPAITRLINAAFIVERIAIEGDRIHAEEVRSRMDSGKFLLAESDKDTELLGCVYVELRGDRGYLGLLAVDPLRQNRGLGRFLVAAAEDYFRSAGCQAVDLRIVSVRTPLPPFYRSLGYAETGTEPFPADQPTKLPCHFIVMSKPLVLKVS